MSGWTPVPEELVQEIGLVNAAVYGSVWRFCSQRQGICFASLETIGGTLGLSRTAVCEALNVLVEKGYLSKEETSSRRPNIYAITDKFPMNECISGVQRGCTPSVHGVRSANTVYAQQTPCTPSVPKKEYNSIKKEQESTPLPPFGETVATQDQPIGPVYTDPNGPVAKAAKRLEKMEKRAVREQASTVVASWDAFRRARIRAVCDAFLRGQAPDGVQIKACPDEYIVAHMGDALAFGDIDPGDIEAATRYYYRSYNGMVSMKKLAIWVHDWLARGKPVYQPKPDKSANGDIEFEGGGGKEEQLEIEAYHRTMALLEPQRR